MTGAHTCATARSPPCFSTTRRNTGQTNKQTGRAPSLLNEPRLLAGAPCVPPGKALCRAGPARPSWKRHHESRGSTCARIQSTCSNHATATARMRSAARAALTASAAPRCRKSAVMRLTAPATQQRELDGFVINGRRAAPAAARRRAVTAADSATRYPSPRSQPMGWRPAALPTGQRCSPWCGTARERTRSKRSR